MPRGNQRGGKKHKRNKNFGGETSLLRIKEDGQEYAKITQCKGNCRFNVICCDGKSRSAILCGTMRKRKFVNQGDIVLVSLRDFQDSICDIIDLYDQSQAKKLKKEKHIPETFELDEGNPYGDDGDTVEFSYDLPDDSDGGENEESDSSDNGSIDLDEI